MIMMTMLRDKVRYAGAKEVSASTSAESPGWEVNSEAGAGAAAEAAASTSG